MNAIAGFYIGNRCKVDRRRRLVWERVTFMKRFVWGLAVCFVVAGFGSCNKSEGPTAGSGDATPSAMVDSLAAGITFNKDIAPMFAASCGDCHGGANMKGGLSLGSYATAIRGGESGDAIIPGDPDGSLLFRLVTKQEEPFMPRKGDPLTDAQIETLRDWIQNGAPEG
jgi:hypothetical protein